MPFSTVFTKIKTFTNGGTLTPTDLNNQIDELGNQIALNNVAGGFNEGANVRRGKFVQSATGTRTNVAYGALSNGPDQVANVVLPTDGLIVVGYQALWQESVVGAARAAIFVAANQLKTGSAGGAPVVNEAQIGNTANLDTPLSTSSLGIQSSAAVTANSTDVTTGQTLGNAGAGGLCYIFAAAGTYTISVQFKASSGTVSVKNRHLWVSTKSFG